MHAKLIEVDGRYMVTVGDLNKTPAVKLDITDDVNKLISDLASH